MTKDEALLMTLATLEEGNFVYPTALRTAIIEALAQPEQPTEKEKISRLMAAEIVSARSLAQPEQEPAATVAEVHMSRYTIEWINGSLPEGTKLYTAPPKRKEWVGLTDVDIFEAEFNRPELMTIGEFISNKLKELNT